MMYRFGTQFLNLLPPETAHEFAIKMLRAFSVKSVIEDLDLSRLKQNVLNLEFEHPLGLAAGFDKHGQVYDKLGQLGFSFVEIGSITPKPQPGNQKPRLFRLPQHQAIINRYGFNSQGQEKVYQNLLARKHNTILGINLGKNKETINEAEDFLKGAELFAKQADYLVINVSSPNTPGLRSYQDPKHLNTIVTGIKNIIKQQKLTVPLFVKLSPDMDLPAETELVNFLLEEAIDGMIISNTTVQRNAITGQYHSETGGLSGSPLQELSTAMLRRVYSITQGKIILIGCGGIDSGKAAYEKLRAGANLLQLYTSFIYQGPLVIRKVLTELNELLIRDGVKNVSEIMGE